MAHHKAQPRESWSNKELSLLQKHYSDMNNEDIALIIKRSPSAIAHKAARIGLRKSEKFLNSEASGRFRPMPDNWFTRLVKFLKTLLHV